uniref:Uncharacterized protein n=1 Tax=Strigamia maritima TaxID=126957 RepID=T1JFD7_STRMM
MQANALEPITMLSYTGLVKILGVNSKENRRHICLVSPQKATRVNYGGLQSTFIYTVEKSNDGVFYLQQEISQIDGLKVLEGITSVENGCVRVPVVNQGAAAVQIKKGRKIGQIEEIFDAPSLQCSEQYEENTDGNSIWVSTSNDKRAKN